MLAGVLAIAAASGCQDEPQQVFAVQLPSAPDPPPPPAATATVQPACGRPVLQPHEVQLDINRAGVQQLAELPGLSSGDAARIAAGRPYHSKRDLLRRHLLSSAQYERVKPRLVAHRLD